MKLRTRLTLITSLVIAVASLIIGAYSVTATRANGMAQIEASLTQVLAATQGTPSKAPTKVTTRADDLVIAVALGVALPDGSITVIRQSGNIYNPLPFPKISKAQTANALRGFITVGGTTPYRARARKLGDGLSVIAAMPLSGLNQQMNNLVTSSSLVVLLIILTGAALIWWVVRRNLKTVDQMIDTATAIAGGDLARVVPSAHEGTELGILGSALNEMITALRSSLQTKAESEARMRKFLGDASHELRTPLTVIKGYAEILKGSDSLSPDQRTRAVARLNAESSRMEALITGLLRLSSLDEKPEISRSMVDFSAVVDDFAHDLKDQENGRTVSIDVEADVFVDGDEALLSQVVANLMANIRQHTPATADVSVSLRANGGQAILTVDDAGPGIPVDQRNLALSRFGRLEESRSRVGGGFGLGLNIAAQVISLHEGSIALDQSPLGGLRTLISIPLADGVGG
ncbi:MAG TPA: HAMP domain-containing sensor histidine kinase [Candidatus Nanopelagicaceae bacterium]|nr:HAMP domain-containing sensor histidine kinase [Candidatus Nanopelagicaceae bacterium]